MSTLTKIFGTHSQRELKRVYPIVDKIESYKEQMGALSDEELKGKTKEYKERLEKGETLDDLLPEAYATVREAARRVLGMEHYRVQLIGGIILHQGRIAEMKTGEGKTLVSTLPAYLNDLEGKGVYIVRKACPQCVSVQPKPIVTDTVHGVHVWCTFRWCCIASATHCSYAYWLVLRHVMRGILSR